jgi:hypothetical protein
MTKKRALKQKDESLRWKKHRGSFTYEIIDPVTGGLWSYYAKRKMSDEELFQRIIFLMTFCKVKRPKRGQVYMMSPVA